MKGWNEEPSRMWNLWKYFARCKNKRLFRFLTFVVATFLLILLVLAFNGTYAGDIVDTVLRRKEWISLYESKIHLPYGRAAQTFCNMTMDPKLALLNLEVSSDMFDWSFTKKRVCPKVDLSDFPIQRQRIVLSCNKTYSNITSLRRKGRNDIFQVSFGNKCLADVIDSCCNKENVSIPNVVHYVWCKKQELGFFQFLSFISVLRFIKPCLILFHGDALPYGKYWNYFRGLYHKIIQVQRPCPAGGIFHRLRHFEHGSDVMRLEALMVYGGMYLDWDEIMLKSVDKLRRYKHTQGHEEDSFLGPQFIMSKKNCTFLQLWYNSYLTDYVRNWNYNALKLPAKLARDYPDEIHLEGKKFAKPSWILRELIYSTNYDWSTNYAMHVFIRDYKYKDHTDIDVIRHLNTTVGAISRHVLFGNKDLCI